MFRGSRSFNAVGVIEQDAQIADRRSGVILLLVCSALLAEDRLTHCKDECLSARKAFAAVCCRSDG